MWEMIVISLRAVVSCGVVAVFFFLSLSLSPLLYSFLCVVVCLWIRRSFLLSIVFSGFLTPRCHLCFCPLMCECAFFALSKVFCISGSAAFCCLGAVGTPRDSCLDAQSCFWQQLPWRQSAPCFLAHGASWLCHTRPQRMTLPKLCASSRARSQLAT